MWTGLGRSAQEGLTTAERATIASDHDNASGYDTECSR